MLAFMAVGAVTILAVALIVLALVWYLVSVILALQRITNGLDEVIVHVGEILQKSAPVNEVVANTPGNASDWVELRNTTGAAVDISGWYVSDDPAHLLKFRLPAGKEREALQDLADTLAKLPEDSTAEFIQNEVYEAGKRHFAQAELRQWFKALYEVLLGSEQGPRMGAFIKLYGRDNVVKLIERALAGEDLSRAA